MFNYIDAGAEGESTLHRNRSAFEEVTFRPRMTVAVPATDLRTAFSAGSRTPRPARLSAIMHPHGEVCAARAAGDAGTTYILSTVLGQPLEEVKMASKGPV